MRAGWCVVLGRGGQVTDEGADFGTRFPVFRTILMNIDGQDGQDDFKSLIDLLVACESFVFEFWITKIDQ